ncbi:protein kinase [Streptomyces sp. NPDC005423]|uniref:serine/threonine-protein kinase n=1 Tax=Streptomyces sp. NPDC005423 TaxID=3155343 RepID=UPI0033B957F7
MRLRDSARAGISRCSADILSGRYRLDGLLGSGGAADVHRGFDLRLRRPVAVKVFRSDTGGDVGENVHAEAVILARLTHPGLVTVYDAGQHDGRVFLVLQLIEGTTLKDRIADGPLSFRATAALGAELAQALTHAHEAKIVHRDVKPSNILLDASQHPYLTDFGISRLLDATTRTATGTLTGTAAYLSPEQVLGKPVGRPADVYALGLVLLECLTGRLEYDGGPLEAAIARLHRQPVVPPQVPRQLADVVRNMTALDEQDRPTAGDCARALAAAAEDADAGSLTGTASAPVTSLVPAPGLAPTAGRTHSDPLPGQPPAAPRTTPVRGRTLVAGAGVALAAVMATAFAVTDNAGSHGKDESRTRVTSSAAGKSQSPGGGGAVEKKAATASTGTPASAAGDAAGSPAGDAPDPSGSAVDGQNITAATHSPTASVRTPSDTATAATTAAAEQSSTTAETTHQPPGQAKKTENPESPEKEKKAKKAKK